ncbi:MAG TPA: BON domain-containing protein [Pyrinomonadaceae bacterium]|nr:BON domain-containing protein [Pyrinomonadaceae bacterium]
MKRTPALIASLILALIATACGGSETNTTNSSNVTVNKNTNTNANANANANSNANSNKSTYSANISKEDFEKAKEDFAQKAKEAGDKIGAGLEDGWLWVKTRGTLLTTSGVESTGINVDVSNGVITLRGTVPSKDQVDKAEAAAKSVSGNKGVQNQLQVSASSSMNENMGNKNMKK